MSSAWRPGGWLACSVSDPAVALKAVSTRNKPRRSPKRSSKISADLQKISAELRRSPHGTARSPQITADLRSSSQIIGDHHRITADRNTISADLQRSPQITVELLADGADPGSDRQRFSSPPDGFFLSGVAVRSWRTRAWSTRRWRAPASGRCSGVDSRVVKAALHIVKFLRVVGSSPNLTRISCLKSGLSLSVFSN